MTDIETHVSAGERVIVSLPLAPPQRETLRAFLAEYDKACDAAWAEYDKARDAAWAEYGKACDAAWAEYGNACDAARAEYGKACDAARAEYDKAIAAAAAECSKALAAHPLAAWIVGGFLVNYENEVLCVLEALADGANLARIQEMAEENGWCEEWDGALAAAHERFDIRGAQ